MRDVGPLRARGLESLKEELVAFCPAVRGLVDAVRSFDDLVFTTYRHVWMPRWFTRHVLVLGDAAHAMSPHLGQGGGIAVLDAWTLAECLNTSPDHRSAFRLYRRRRAAHVRYQSAITFLLSPFFQGDSVWKAPWRNLTLPVMARPP